MIAIRGATLEVREIEEGDEMDAGAIVGIIIAVLAIVLVARSVTTVRQHERAVIERLGKYKGHKEDQQDTPPGVPFRDVPWVKCLEVPTVAFWSTPLGRGERLVHR